MLPVGWLHNILRQDVNLMHCYQLASEQLEFGAGPVWDVQHQQGSFPRDESFLLWVKVIVKHSADILVDLSGAIQMK